MKSNRKEPRRTTVYIFKNGETTVLSSDRDGLPSAFVNQVLEDRKCNVWLAIGSNGASGLARFENGKNPSLRQNGRVFGRGREK